MASKPGMYKQSFGTEGTVFTEWLKNIFYEGTWTPTFTNLTVVGSITPTGRFTRIGRICFYTITLTSSGGGTSASVAGTTYHDLPIAPAVNGNCEASRISTAIGIGTGFVDATNSRGYPPTWAATANNIIISGWYEVI